MNWCTTQQSFALAVIKPVLEYCSCIRHHNIAQSLSAQIESIQKPPAITIILNGGRDTSYTKSLPINTDICYLQQIRNILSIIQENDGNF